MKSVNPEDCIIQAIDFNKRNQPGRILRSKDSFGQILSVTLTGPARVLGDRVVIPVKEHPGVIFLDQVLDSKEF